MKLNFALFIKLQMTNTTTYPWPRKAEERGKPIVDPAVRTKDPAKICKDPSFAARKFDENWDAYDSLVYNAWLGVRVLPTKILDRDFLSRLGILEPVLTVVKSIGLGRLGITEHVLYSDLVRQFMASLRIHYKGGAKDNPKYGELHFKLNGTLFFLSMTEVGNIYGLDCSGKTCHLPKTPMEANALLKLIGENKYSTNRTKQLEVQHPVLRYVLKLLASNFFLSQESSKLRIQELFLLVKGLGKDVFPRGDVAVVEKPHLGAAFAHQLLSMQSFPFDNQNGTAHFGSLLTPLFEWCKATKDAIKVDKKISYLERMHFIHGGNLTAQWKWIFLINSKEYCVQLPFPDYTSIDTTAKLLFQPPASSFTECFPSRKRANPSAPKSSSESSRTSEHQIDNEVRPDYTDQAEVNRWLVQSQKRQHILLLDILKRLPKE